MSLRDRIAAGLAAEMERVAVRLAELAPIPPSVDDLPESLERARAYWQIGNPDIHYGGRTAPPFLKRN